MVFHRRWIAAAVLVFVTAACGERNDGDGRNASTTASAVQPGDSSGNVTNNAEAPATVAANAGPADAALDSTAPPSGGSQRPRRVVVHGIDLTGIGYDVGNPAAPIVLVNFSDFGCPFCGSFARETHPALDAEFIRTGKVFFKYVPFVMGMFPNAAEATRAAECSAEQGGFWPMHDRLYGAQAEWKRSRSPEPMFRRYAASAGLDTVRFSACDADRRTDERTERANDRANRLGIRATPTFFVNDRQIEGALPLAEFRRILTSLAP